MRAGQELGMSAGIKVAVQVRMEVAAIPVCLTGTKSRDLLPLWKRAARGIGLERSLEGPYYAFDRGYQWRLFDDVSSDIASAARLRFSVYFPHHIISHRSFSQFFQKGVCFGATVNLSKYLLSQFRCVSGRYAWHASI